MKGNSECSYFREQFVSYLSGNLTSPEETALNDHLANCRSCADEFAETEHIWNMMGELPQAEPSGFMKQGFETIMAGYEKQALRKRRSFRNLVEEIFRLPAGNLLRQPVFSFLLLFAGIVAGYLLHQPEKMLAAQNMQIDSLSSQISGMRQLIVLSLLQDQSASRRIQAVSYTDEMTDPDAKISEALFTTLNGDPNVNVRLATLEALARMADNPVVREGLVRSIELQESPIMQSAIADVMVKLQEKKSVEPLQKLLERKDINSFVRSNIEKSIQQLI